MGNGTAYTGSYYENAMATIEGTRSAFVQTTDTFEVNIQHSNGATEIRNNINFNGVDTITQTSENAATGQNSLIISNPSTIENKVTGVAGDFTQLLQTHGTLKFQFYLGVLQFYSKFTGAGFFIGNNTGEVFSVNNAGAIKTNQITAGSFGGVEDSILTLFDESGNKYYIHAQKQ